MKTSNYVLLQAAQRNVRMVLFDAQERSLEAPVRNTLIITPYTLAILLPMSFIV